MSFDELVFGTYDETVTEGVHCVNTHAQRRVENVSFVFSVVGTQNHLTIISADENHSSSLRPRVAREVCRDISSLLEIVDLRVFLSEDSVIFLLPLLHVDESVPRARD